MNGKITIALVLALATALTASEAAFAAKRGTKEYEAMVELKNKQRAEREAEKANPTEQGKGFWQREAERSGLAGTAAMLGNGVDRIIPGEGAGARKEKS